MPAASVLIRTEKLTKVYSTGKVQVEALQDVTLDLEEGSVVSVTGASGSGKSTLLNLIGGLDTPSSGTIEVGGKRISEMSKDELALHRRFGAGMIFQSFNLISSRTALENVELPLIFSGVMKKERKKRAAEMLEKVGLSAARTMNSRSRPSPTAWPSEGRVSSRATSSSRRGLPGKLKGFPS